MGRAISATVLRPHVASHSPAIALPLSPSQLFLPSALPCPALLCADFNLEEKLMPDKKGAGGEGDDDDEEGDDDADSINREGAEEEDLEGFEEVQGGSEEGEEDS